MNAFTVKCPELPALILCEEDSNFTSSEISL